MSISGYRPRRGDRFHASKCEGVVALEREGLADLESVPGVKTLQSHLERHEHEPTGGSFRS